MRALVNDLRFAVRLLARSPLLTFVAVASFAVGIGLNTAVFSLVDTLLLRPVAGVAEPGEVVAVYGTAGEGSGYLPVSRPDYRDVVERNQAFLSLSAHQLTQVGASLQGETHQLIAELVSENFFSTLGVRAVVGTLAPLEGVSTAHQPVVVLSNSFWRRQFAADQNVIGRSVRLNGHPFTIVGVVQKDFRGVNAVVAPEIWAPLEAYRSLSLYPELYELRGGQVLQVTGRLRPGRSLASAQEELRGIAADLARTYPSSNRGRSFAAIPLSQAVIHPNRRPGLVRAGGLLMGLVGLLLLITCGNVANLLLAKAATRGREIAIRAALGADRARIGRQLVTESLLLSGLGGVGAIFVAKWMAPRLWSLRPPIFEASGLIPTIDGRTMGFLLAVSLLTGLLVGISPLLHTLRGLSFSRLVQSRSTGQTSSAARVLVALQVAFCCVILTCSALLLKHLANSRQVKPGFETEHLLTASYDLRFRDYDELAGKRFHDRLRTQLASLPGVKSAALAEVGVFDGFRIRRRAVSVGAEIPAEDGPLSGSIAVGEDYFRTVGISILRGRAFDEHDQSGTPPVAIVNEAMARRIWPKIDLVGRSLRLDEESVPVEIVGVARDARHLGLTADAEPVIYLPLAQRYSSAVTLHVRTEGSPLPMLSIVRRALRGLDRELPLTELRPIAESLDRSLWMQQLSTGATALLGALALALACLGLYGVMSYFVSSRSRELGVRIALGARPASLLGYVLAEGGRVVGIGLLLGIGPALLLGSRVASLLREGGSEMTSFLAVSLLMLGTGALANTIPALRAIRTNPVRSLQTG